MKELHAERNAEIVRLRDSGLMPAAIAKQLGMTRNAVIGTLNRKGKCTPGFHGGAKITEADVLWLRASGRGEVQACARALGLSASAAYRAKRGDSWANVE